MIDYTKWFNQQLDMVGEWEWTESGVDVVLSNTNADNNKTIIIEQLLDFFDKIDVAFLGLGNITKLYEAGWDTPERIITATEASLVDVIGKNGSKVYNSIQQKLSGIPLYKLIGAHSTQRGIGVRKMRTLEMALGDTFADNPSVAKYKAVDKFDIITATGATAAINAFKAFYRDIQAHVTIESAVATSSAVVGVKFCFTGFRDKEMQQQIEKAGGTVGSSVSKHTNYVVTSDPTGTSSKLTKARDLHIKIIEPRELLVLLSQ